ncbi:MAG: TorF family putative porin [Gemmatimonadales bacterium]|nr:TorF family putative porin [Gemmatimonadales bacterium]
MSLGIRRLRPALVGGALLAIVPRLHAQAAAEADSAPKLEVYAEARVVSRYAWRGYDLSRAKPAFQPYVEVTLPSGLGFNAFTTSALDRQTELDEAQLGLTFRREVRGAWEVGFGYLLYVMPGTQTEPSPEGPDSLSPAMSGEFVASVTRNWSGGYATLTYARGHGSGVGNSVNLWVQHTLAWAGGRWSAEPYVQVDYLDEYGPPSGFGDRMSGVEIGVPVYRQLGAVRLQLAGYLTVVPSGYVRGSNGAAGGSARRVLPWAAAGVVYERE